MPAADGARGRRTRASSPDGCARVRRRPPASSTSRAGAPIVDDESDDEGGAVHAVGGDLARTVEDMERDDARSGASTPASPVAAAVPSRNGGN